MIRRLLPFLPLLLLLPLAGVECMAREHLGEYVPFLKQRHSLTFLFRNGARCGECDTIALDSLKPEDVSAFSDYCAARFGLEVRPCHAIFREQDLERFETGR